MKLRYIPRATGHVHWSLMVRSNFGRLDAELPNNSLASIRAQHGKEALVGTVVSCTW